MLMSPKIQTYTYSFFRLRFSVSSSNFLVKSSIFADGCLYMHPITTWALPLQGPTSTQQDSTSSTSIEDQALGLIFNFLRHKVLLHLRCSRRVMVKEIVLRVSSVFETEFLFSLNCFRICNNIRPAIKTI